MFFTIDSTPGGMVALNDRLRMMPPVRDPKKRRLHYRKFNKGISGWGKWTGDDYVAFLQLIPYVIGTGTAVLNFSDECRRSLIEACFLVLQIYRMSKYYETTEAKLNDQHAKIKKLGNLMSVVVDFLPDQSVLTGNVDIPKVHGPLHFRYPLKHMYLSYRFVS